MTSSEYLRRILRKPQSYRGEKLNRKELSNFLNLAMSLPWRARVPKHRPASLRNGGHSVICVLHLDQTYSDLGTMTVLSIAVCDPSIAPSFGTKRTYDSTSHLPTDSVSLIKIIRFFPSTFRRSHLLFRRQVRKFEVLKSRPSRH